MAEDITPLIDDSRVTESFDRINAQIQTARAGAAAFGRVMTEAFSQSIIGGRSFDDVLKSLTLRLSDMALKAALKPIENGLVQGIEGLFASGLSKGLSGGGSVTPFASGGVIGAPSYFPMTGGGIGLAGEAGPEAIMPLSRGADGRLGVRAAAASPSVVTVNIATPDADSFRRSALYVTGQIARAVARGQRGL